MTPHSQTRPETTGQGYTLAPARPVCTVRMGDLRDTVNPTLGPIRRSRLGDLCFSDLPELGRGFGLGPFLIQFRDRVSLTDLLRIGGRCALRSAPPVQILAQIGNQLGGYLPDTAHDQSLSSFAGFVGEEANAENRHLDTATDLRNDAVKMDPQIAKGK